MQYTSSQEQTIYRSLAGQLQLGFFQDGERFPSVQDIASYYQVSYCPAQRALKALERNGLIQHCRGKETVVLAKPHENYLDSHTFRRRLTALIDLSQALELLSPCICLQGFCAMDQDTYSDFLTKAKQSNHPAKRLYQSYDQALRSLGNQTILSLYYDIGAFLESSFLDILTEKQGKEAGQCFLESLTKSLCDSLKDCQEHRYDAAERRLNKLRTHFFQNTKQYFEQLQNRFHCEEQETFIWEPHKGRKKYCDLVAIDLVCRINEGRYPIGVKLPSKAVLANRYHVSEITIRRTIDLLNQLGITRNINGIGTEVISTGDLSLTDEFKPLMISEHLRTFLESLQLLALTSEAVISYTLPHCSAKSLESITHAIKNAPTNLGSMTMIHSACLQVVIDDCPNAAIREIYEKMLLLLLNGSILRFNGEQLISQWTDVYKELSDSFDAGDYQSFAKAYGHMAQHTFRELKERLRTEGMHEVEKIADLINSERSSYGDNYAGGNR